MDSFIYALVFASALRELLPRSGVPATTQNIGFYGGLLFAVFLIGWGLSFLWGPIADRFGRVRTLMLTILCYSAFTFAGALATNVWQLGVFRLLAGIGIGGEWTLGGILVAEEWPDARRIFGGSAMHTGYYFGMLLASFANFTIGTHFGWRSMFVLGGLPALLVAFIRSGVHEPDRWARRAKEMGRQLTARSAFLTLFSREYRRRTVLNAAYVLISMVGLWAGSIYVPAALTELAIREHRNATDASRLASAGSILLSLGTIVGCLLVPILARYLDRRSTLAFFYVLMAGSILFTFGYVFYWPEQALTGFIACLFFLGLGGASFCVYTVWLPEQYRTECRASAFAFSVSFGRFIAAGATFAVGSAIAAYGSLGRPIAATGLVFLLGLLILPFGNETSGTALSD
jgi:MFS family permease